MILDVQVMKFPSELPKDLHHLAAKLSWRDAVNLLCLTEGWAMKATDLEIREKCWSLADKMRMLVRALPYEWQPPLVEEHSILTAMAAYCRTGMMPKAPPGYLADREFHRHGE